MEKKEMSFTDKFKAAGNELEKEIKDGAAMILIAIDGDGGIYANILGENRMLSTLLSYAALKSDGFEEIISKSIKALEIYREKYNK